jgi:hypothetical protein
MIQQQTDRRCGLWVDGIAAATVGARTIGHGVKSQELNLNLTRHPRLGKRLGTLGTCHMPVGGRASAYALWLAETWQSMLCHAPFYAPLHLAEDHSQ